MFLFNKNKREIKPECNHKYKTIRNYEVKHVDVFCYEYITLHYIQECEVCHALKHYSFEIG